MTEPDRILVSDRFINRRIDSSVEIRVAQPQLIPSSEKGEFSAYWRCEYLLIHDDVATLGFCGGESWMQSFLLAYEAVTTIIKPLDIEWETPDGLPAWLVIPRLVPIGWNYDFYAKVIRFIEERDDAMNAQVEARRVSRSGNHGGKD